MAERRRGGTDLLDIDGDTDCEEDDGDDRDEEGILMASR